MVKTRVRPLISSTFCTPLLGERRTISPLSVRKRFSGPTRAARPVESMKVTLVMSTTTLFSPLLEMAISASRTRPEVAMSISPDNTRVVGLVVSATSMRRLRLASGTGFPPVLRGDPTFLRKTARQLYAEGLNIQCLAAAYVGRLGRVSSASVGSDRVDRVFRHEALLYAGI